MRLARFLTYRGDTLTLEQWALFLGITTAALHYRLTHWPLGRALTEEPTKRARFKPIHCSACGRAGHNRLTCAERLRVTPPLEESRARLEQMAVREMEELRDKR